MQVQPSNPEAGMGRQHRRDVGSGHKRRPLDLALACLGLLLCGYLVSPALHAVHLEGYTAQMQSIALLKSFAPAIEHDPWLPLVSQFIHQTRSGIIDLLTAIFRIFPNSGDLGFRAVVLTSLIVLLVTSVMFARRWSHTTPLFALFALVLVPGIPETAFFFNDNIVSAAFATTALALVTRRTNKLAALLSGVCFGAAVLTRIDAIFILPLILGTVFYSAGSRRDKLIACAIGGLTALAVMTASAVVHGFSLLDAFVTAQRFVPKLSEVRWLWVRLFFFGLAAIPVLLVGGWLGYRRLKNERSTVGILTFIVYPLLLVALAPKATEVRYIFPLLAPLVALHGGVGLHWLYQQLRGGPGTRPGMAWGIVAFACVVFLAPLTWVKILDGPRYILGRLWSPPQWTNWQASVDESMKRTAALVAALDDGRQNVVLATHFNDEFYLRLRLMEAGFLPLPAADRYPGCTGMSLFVKGPSSVMHIRTNPQYRIAPLSYQYNASLQLVSAFECPAVRAASKTYVTAFGDYEWDLVPEVYSFNAASFEGPAVVRFSDTRDLLRPKGLPSFGKFGLVLYRELGAQELQATLANSREYLRYAAQRDTISKRFVTIEEYAQSYRPMPGPTSELLSRFNLLQ